MNVRWKGFCVPVCFVYVPFVLLEEVVTATVVKVDENCKVEESPRLRTTGTLVHQTR